MKYIRTDSFKRLFSKKIRKNDSNEEEDEGKSIAEAETKFQKKPTWKCFSFDDIFHATNGFHSDNLVGKGGYAEVYKGILEDGVAIAVKRLTKSSPTTTSSLSSSSLSFSSSDEERKEKEFLMEIGTIGHVCHPNVSSLLGCCIDNGLYLIFHLSSNGSVASLLHDEKLPILSWKVRYKIAIGAARGLHYLHRGCQRRIIHRDIKASNILVNADFEPQISDFGLAKWLPSQWTHHLMVAIEGTIGYLAPEYFMHGIVDEKTDVFAFGVFLLEIISGRKPVDESHQCLHTWAKSIMNQGSHEKLVDQRLGREYDDKQLKRLAFVASLCIRTSSTWRPTMSEVLELIVEDEIDEERWNMPKGEEDEEEFWGFEDLECEFDSFSSTSSS